MTDDEEEGSGEAWSDILAARSPEGRAVVDELRRAEQVVLSIQGRIMSAITDGRDWAEDFSAFEAAFAEVDRMRQKVYHLARQ